MNNPHTDPDTFTEPGKIADTATDVLRVVQDRAHHEYMIAGGHGRAARMAMVRDRIAAELDIRT